MPPILNHLGLLHALEIRFDLLTAAKFSLGRGASIVRADDRRGDDTARAGLGLATGLNARSNPTAAVEVADKNRPLLLEGARGLGLRAPHGDWDTVQRTGIGTPCSFGSWVCFRVVNRASMGKICA
jgi:hypothetical protein